MKLNFGPSPKDQDSEMTAESIGIHLPPCWEKLRR